MKYSIVTFSLAALLLAVSGCATTSLSGRSDCRQTAHACDQCGRGNCQRNECRQNDCIRPDDFSAGAVPVKPGTYMNDWSNAMRCAARTDQFVVPRNAWFNGGAELGPEASENMNLLAARLNGGSDHVLLEREPVQPEYTETLADAKSRTNHLNTSRRSAVVAALQTAGVADAESRVHLSTLENVGIRGIEAPRVFNLLFLGGNNRGGGRNGFGGQGQGGFGGGGGGGFGGGRGF